MKIYDIIVVYNDFYSEVFMPFSITDFFTFGFVMKYIRTYHPGFFAGGTVEALPLTLMIISVLVIMAASYLLGSINFAIIISKKQYNEDIRSHGSQNAGMTNMMRTYGKRAAGYTLLGDALKAVVACLIGYALLGQLGAHVAGIFCVCGHIFPAFYGFKGGKGVVTTAITVLMCNPFVFLIVFFIFVVIVLFTKYISLGSIISVLLYPILLDRIERFFHGTASPYTVFAIILAVIVVIKHKDNIKRLMEGKENKFSFKKSVSAPAESADNNKEEEK